MSNAFSTDSNIIVRVALPVPLYQIFDYKCLICDPELKPGLRIKVPFGKKELVGILLETGTKTEVPQNKLKPIIEILDQEPLIPQELLNLCQWTSQYYHHPLGDVFSNALPALLRQGKKATLKNVGTGHDPSVQKKIKIILNSAQKNAIDAIKKSFDQFQCFLLDGVTGSGKTEVYLNLIESVVQQGRQALVLIPEIALTPQTLARFEERFTEPIAVLHSGLAPRARLNAWLLAKEGHAKIVIGTRSAIFTPLQHLGIIIVDEEHDPSFKQQDGMRYSARDLAVFRAHFNQIPVVLGSATPSLESLYNVRYKQYCRLELPERAGTAIHPHFHLIDIRNLRLQHGLSRPLLKIMENHLKRGNQVLLFLNRRGYAPTLMCHVCGWIAKCTNCDAHMTLHHHPAELRCHHCNRRQSIPEICPTCHGANLDDVGVGTQRLETFLKKHFPHIPVVRVDRDSTRKKDALEAMIENVQSGHRQILIGTQMLAKGHHFPNVTLVGIINADAGFFSADFRSLERIGQLLVQVSGRAGRAEKPGEVFIQTLHPEHPLLLKLIQSGYADFSEFLLDERKDTGLPPFVHFTLIRAYSKQLKNALGFLTQIKNMPFLQKNDRVKISGPVPATMARRKNHYYAQLLFESKSRQALHRILDKIIPQIEPHKSVRWSIDVDPIEIC
ncbi:MAG: primosomal protein N' [Gammaproteobacteria bacterium]|nr:primosomal protein N' [Gammaproteobacteria bacterium]